MSGAVNTVALDVNREVPEAYQFFPTIVAPAQSCANSRDKFLGLKGLWDIVIGTGFKPRNNIRRIGAGSEHDNRNIRLTAYLTTNFNSVDIGQHQIEKHQVWCACVKYV